MVVVFSLTVREMNGMQGMRNELGNSDETKGVAAGMRMTAEYCRLTSGQRISVAQAGLLRTIAL